MDNSDKAIMEELVSRVEALESEIRELRGYIDALIKLQRDTLQIPNF